MKQSKETSEQDILNQQEGKRKLFEPNYQYIFFFNLTIGLGGVMAGYIVSEMNQMNPVLSTFLDWDEQEFLLYTSLLNTLRIVGGIIGAMGIGKVMKYGRRKCLLVVNGINIFGAVLSIVGSVPVIIFGRFLKGIAFTSYLVLSTKMIQESVPTQAVGYSVSFVNIGKAFGFFLPTLLGLGYQETDENTNQSDINNYWRFCFLFPISISLLQVACLVFLYRFETVLFSVSLGQREAATAFIRRLYAADESPAEVYESLQEDLQLTSNGQGTGLCEILKSKGQRKTAWLISSLYLFHIISGVSFLLMYSRTLLEEMDEDGSFALSPTVGTVLLGASTLVGALVAPFITIFFGRKSLLVAGQVLCGIFLTLIGVFTHLNLSVWLLVFLYLHMTTVVCTIGNNINVYASEISSSGTMLSIGFWVDQLTSLLVTFSGQYLFYSGLTPAGTFLLLGALTLIGGLHHKLMLKETAGLTISEKLNLYRRQSSLLQGSLSRKLSTTFRQVSAAEQIIVADVHAEGKKRYISYMRSHSIISNSIVSPCHQMQKMALEDLEKLLGSPIPIGKQNPQDAKMKVTRRSHKLNQVRPLDSPHFEKIEYFDSGRSHLIGNLADFQLQLRKTASEDPASKKHNDETLRHSSEDEESFSKSLQEKAEEGAHDFEDKLADNGGDNFRTNRGDVLEELEVVEEIEEELKTKKTEECWPE